jgi:hypothetical protein
VNTAQRVVLVVALGIAMIAVAGALNLLLLDRIGAGWFSLDESTGATFSPSQTDTYYVVPTDRAIVEQAGIWLLALATWGGASLWLLRTRPTEASAA